MRIPLWLYRLLHRQKLSRRTLRGTWLHSRLGDRILEKELWRPTRNSIARAWLVGFPITMVPFLPGQSVFATAAAFFVRGNILLAIALQFLSNPITAPVHLAGAYFVGEVVRGRPPQGVMLEAWDSPEDLISVDAVISLYLGAAALGILGGVVGYALLLRYWPEKSSAPSLKPPSAGSA